MMAWQIYFIFFPDFPRWWSHGLLPFPSLGTFLAAAKKSVPELAIAFSEVLFRASCPHSTYYILAAILFCRGARYMGVRRCLRLYFF